MKKMTPTQKQTVIRSARQHCEKRGARFTVIREQVLEIVLGYSDVVKAYDVLSDLQKIRGHAAPPTVYRALDFLADIGILHRTESLNGYVFCPDFTSEHVSIITNCRDCGRTEEVPADQQVADLLNFCSSRGFRLSHEPVVLPGVCADCQSKEEQEESFER